MIDILLPEHVRELIAPHAPPCVSVFLPTHRVTPESRQDPLRLKNLLQDAESDLLAIGVRRPQAQAVLQPARELLQDARFWSHQGDGLALFLAPGWSRRFRLPVGLPELAVVAERAHIKPLLPLLATDGHFFVLALGLNHLRLLHGSRQSIDQVELPDAPQGLQDALRFDDLEKQQHLHISGRGGAGAPAVFHGHGIGGEVDKALVERYLRAVDAGLAPVLAGPAAPVVLAGVRYVLDRFRGLTRCPQVLDEGIEGSPDQVSPAELHARAWAIVQPLFTRALEDAAERYLSAAGRGELTGASVEDVVPAALEGRVETLFVPTGVQRWGRVDSATHRVTTHPERRPGDEDLLDRAAVETMLGSGQVFAVPAGQVPAPGPLAAVLRY